MIVLLFDEGAPEQHVVLEVDVDHQLLLELSAARGRARAT